MLELVSIVARGALVLTSMLDLVSIVARGALVLTSTLELVSIVARGALVSNLVELCIVKFIAVMDSYERSGWAVLRLSGLMCVALASACADARDTGAPNADTPNADTPSRDAAEGVRAEDHTGDVTDPGFIYGRVATDDGSVFEGRIRWGTDEEALWTHYFNGAKSDNPWVAALREEERPTERRAVGLLGVEVVGWDREVDLARPFMVRFGDLARIEPRGRALDVTLRSGTTVHLDRFGADDLADGLQVWDTERGRVELDEWSVVSIDFMSPAAAVQGPPPLRGTVRAGSSTFTGLIQWNRQQSLRDDELRGESDAGETTFTFAEIRSIERSGPEAVRITTVAGELSELSGTRSTGLDHRGVYVDDARFGRVLVSWQAFDRVDFADRGEAGNPDAADRTSARPTGVVAPAYHDFEVGHALAGTVATRHGEVLRGRLVFDLDESETTETLDAPAGGIDYTIPFALVRSITRMNGSTTRPDGSTARPGASTTRPDGLTTRPDGSTARPDGSIKRPDGSTARPDGSTTRPDGSTPLVRIELADGRTLDVEPEGDVGPDNAGVLVFADDDGPATYVPWADVGRIEFSLDRDPAPH